MQKKVRYLQAYNRRNQHALIPQGFGQPSDNAKVLLRGFGSADRELRAGAQEHQGREIPKCGKMRHVSTGQQEVFRPDWINLGIRTKGGLSEFIDFRIEPFQDPHHFGGLDAALDGHGVGVDAQPVQRRLQIRSSPETIAGVRHLSADGIE
jgi:hypothetical protein